MKATPFAEQNLVLAKDQPEYQPLPVYRDPEGCVVSCWRLTTWERLKLLVTGRVWVLQLTFGDPLQPQLLTATNPIEARPANRPEPVK